MQFNRFKYTTWVSKLSLWNHKRLSSEWSKFAFEQQEGIQLAAWGCHRPELDVQPRPAVECWEVLPMPLTLLGWGFLIILPLALSAGTALSPGICHVLALPRNGPRDFAVCELLPIFSSPSLYYMCPLGSCRCAVQKNMWPICVPGNDIYSPLICKIPSPESVLYCSLNSVCANSCWLCCLCHCLEGPELGSWCFVALMFWTMCFTSHLMPYRSFEGIRCCNSRS